MAPIAAAAAPFPDPEELAGRRPSGTARPQPPPCPSPAPEWRDGCGLRPAAAAGRPGADMQPSGAPPIAPAPDRASA